MEEDFGLCRVDVEINPAAPRGQAFEEGDEAVHVLGHGGAILYVVPSATTAMHHISWYEVGGWLLRNCNHTVCEKSSYD